MLIASVASADDRCVVLDVDAATGKVTAPAQNATKTDAGWRVPSGVPLYVRLTGTNTVLYAHSSQAKNVEVPEIADLNSFFKTLKPYFPDIANATYAAPRGAKPAGETSLKKITDALATIDRTLYGADGIWNTNVRALSAFHEAARGHFEPSRNLRGDLSARLEPGYTVEKTKLCGCAELGCPKVTDLHLTAPATLLKALNELSSSIYDPAVRQEDPSMEITVDGRSKGTVTEILDKARAAIDDRDKLLSAAYGVEELVRIAVNACGTWSTDETKLAWNAGRAFTITRSPRKQDVITTLASDADQRSYDVTTLPQWVVRPALGISFLSMPQARYPNYATNKVDDTHFTIVEKGAEDRRFQWAATLGLTWAPLDWRERGRALAVWLPELHVNPSNDVKALAVGPAISWRFVKIGGGWAWTKHTALDKQHVNDTLASSDALATKSVYGKPKPYLAISLIGWQPFKE